MLKCSLTSEGKPQLASAGLGHIGKCINWDLPVEQKVSECPKNYFSTGLSFSQKQSTGFYHKKAFGRNVALFYRVMIFWCLSNQACRIVQYLLTKSSIFKTWSKYIELQTKEVLLCVILFITVILSLRKNLFDQINNDDRNSLNYLTKPTKEFPGYIVAAV